MAVMPTLKTRFSLMSFRIFRAFCLSFLLMLAPSLHARSVRDTLRINYNDMVVIIYDVQVDNDVATIEFQSPTIRMKSFPKGIDARDVKVMFFDKKYNFGDMELDEDGITDLRLVSLSDGMEVESKNRKDGYFILNDVGQRVKLTLRLKSDNPSTLQIPVYLAQYKGVNKVKQYLGKKRSKYQLFQSLDDLVVPLQKKQKTPASPVTPIIRPRTVTVTDEGGPVDLGQGGGELPFIPGNSDMPSLQDDTQALKNEMEALRREIVGTQTKEELKALKSKMTGFEVAVENVPSLRGQYKQLEEAFISQEKLLDQIEHDIRIREMIGEMATLQLNIEDAKSSDQLGEYKRQMNALAPKIREVGGEVESRFNILNTQYEEKENELKKQGIWRYVVYALLGLLGIILMMLLGFLKSKIQNKHLREMMNGVESEARRATSRAGRPSAGSGLSGIKGRFMDRMKHQAEWTMRGKVDKAVSQGFSKSKSSAPKTPGQDTTQKPRTPGSTNRSASPKRDVGGTKSSRSPQTPYSSKNPKTSNKGGKNNRHSI